MKISVIQENLARGLQVVSRGVSARPSLPVLGNVLLKTEEGGLKLTATNLEIGLTHWVPAKVEADGAITIPARLFTDFVNSLPNERIDPELQGSETIEVRCGRYEAHFKGIDAEEFPAILSAGERPTTRVAQQALKEALAQVTFAAASDETRPVLTGVLTRFAGEELTLAAADNYRISVKTIATQDPVEDTSIVVPARSYVELTRILGDVDDTVDVLLPPGRNQVVFHLESIELVSRLIEGQFPNYQQILPSSHTTRAVVERAQLLEAVRLASLIASSSANVVKLVIPGEGDGAVTVTAAAEIGDDQGQVDAAVEGDGTTIAFNARYLGDVLQNVEVEQFALELNGPLSPGIFRPVGSDDYVHVIMPVRTAS